MDQDDKLPRFSYDLIEWLDENIATPKWPLTVDGLAGMDAEVVRRAAFTSGARALVEQLKDWLIASEDNDDEIISVSDGPTLRYPEVFEEDGVVRGAMAPSRVVDLDTGPLSSAGDRDGD